MRSSRLQRLLKMNNFAVFATSVDNLVLMQNLYPKLSLSKCGMDGQHEWMQNKRLTFQRLLKNMQLLVQFCHQLPFS